MRKVKLILWIKVASKRALLVKKDTGGFEKEDQRKLM
jgi:hypothetical protein